MADDLQLAYNALCSVDAALKRAIASKNQKAAVLSQIQYAIAEARDRLTGIAFPHLFPREAPEYPETVTCTDTDLERP